MLKYGTLLKIEILHDKNGVKQTNTLFSYASVNECWKDWYFNTTLSLFLKYQDGQYASEDLFDGQSPLFPNFFHAGVTDTVNIASAQEKHQENLAKTGRDRNCWSQKATIGCHWFVQQNFSGYYQAFHAQRYVQN